jgi:hypothetical protein
MEQDTSPLNMFQKLNSESFSLARSWDESGDILEYESPSLMFHHSEIRDKRRKGIIRDLRSDIRDRLDQGRLSSIREADNPDISHELQLELHDAFFSLVTELGEVWCLTGRPDEVSIPESSPSSLADSVFLLLMRKIHHQFLSVWIRYDRAKWYLHDRRFPILSSHDLRPSAFSIFRTNEFLMTEF